uniref:Solute carrier family 40 protein n=1 Tax=Chaetoceros debilis TaxID=122233 RepID=A0A7S3PWE3_9STRA|mmetsp:Transcript_18866/g.28685  ORF Transcript_18866/g.28685 Transcript_18866/m.28685 type:complete len:700 (-) Transcript_18866:312-2411(-)
MKLKTKRKTRRLKLKKHKKKMNLPSVREDEKDPNEASPLLLAFSTNFDKQKSLGRENLEIARRILYVSHLSAKFTEVGWQFCLILFLTALAGYQSLVLVSTYGLFSGLVVCLFGSTAGSIIDNPKYSRWSIAKVLIWTQNISIVVATLCCFYLLRMIKLSDISSISLNEGGGDEDQVEDPNTVDANVNNLNSDGDSNGNTSDSGGNLFLLFFKNMFRDFIPPSNAVSIFLVVALHIFGALAKLTDQAMTVAMERDWIVVMSKVVSSDMENTNLDEESMSLSVGQSASIGSFSTSSVAQSGDSIVSSGEVTVGSISVGNDNHINQGILRQLKEKTWLTQTNTSMKQIDLLCKVVGPAAAGIFVASFDEHDPLKTITTNVMHWYHLSYAAIIVGILNLISLYVEYTCTKKIYELVPLLTVRRGYAKEVDTDTASVIAAPSKSSKVTTPTDIHRQQSDNTMVAANKHKVDKEKVLDEAKIGSDDSADQAQLTTIGCGIFQLPYGLSLFLEQPVATGGLALSLLYLNILSFGALMTAYLVWIGLDYGTIGTLRGVSSVVGLLGTVVFRISSERRGLAVTGMWSITFQFVCLSLCLISLRVHNFGVALWLLVIGVCLSRVGLWVFDLTITQYMQEQIPEEIRGAIGGVQKSLNSFFDLTTYALGLIFSAPEQFWVLVAIGYGSVGVAMLLYFFGIFSRRKTLAL